MDVDPRVEDLTGSEADDEEISGGEVASSPSGSLSSGSGLSGSSLYDDGDPDENSKPIPVREPPVLAMLPGPSVVMTLVPIKEDMDVLNDPRFIPPSLHGDDVAGPDVPQEEEGEVKEEEPEGKVAGTLEFWAGDYE